MAISEAAAEPGSGRRRPVVTRFDRVLSWFFARFLLILVFPTIISYAAYLEAFRSIRRSIEETQRASLVQAVRDVDNSLNEIRNLSFTLANDPKILRLLRMTDPLSPVNYTFLRETGRGLPPYHVTNNLVFDYFIHIKRSDVIITPQTISIRIPLYYLLSLNYRDLSYEEWYSLFFDAPHSDTILAPLEISVNEKIFTLISYLQSIPMEYPDFFEGTILVLLKADVLAEMLAGLTVVENSWAAIVDDDMRIIVSLGPVPEEVAGGTYSADLGGEAGSFEDDFGNLRFHVSYQRSLRRDWTLLAGVPRAAFRAGVRSIQRFAIGMTALSVVLGIVAALLLAYRSSRPFRSVIGLLKDSGGGPDSNDLEPGQLHGAVARLIGSNERLQRELERGEPFILDALFERLMLGQISERSEIRTIAETGVFGTESRYFLCLVAHLHGYDEILKPGVVRNLNIARTIARDVMARVFKGVAYIHDTDIVRMTLLLHLDLEDGAACREFAAAMAEKTAGDLRRSFGLHLSFSGGSVVDDILAVYRSYAEAMQADSGPKLDETTPVAWFGTESFRSDRFYYPFDLEIVLLNSLRSGNRSSSLQVLSSVFEENFVKRRLDAPAALNLLTEIKGTFSRMADELDKPGSSALTDVREHIDRLDIAGRIQDFFTEIRGLCDLMCRLADRRKKSHNVELLDRVLEYIRESYADPDLTLGTVAEKIGLTEVYLSRFFKEQTGENFIVFLTRLRIERARELLALTPSIPINRLACEVGYSNTDTFRRAFKRVIGASPTRIKYESADR